MICSTGGAIAWADLFDHPETLRRLYPRLVRSYALDALGMHLALFPSEPRQEGVIPSALRPRLRMLKG